MMLNIGLFALVLMTSCNSLSQTKNEFDYFLSFYKKTELPIDTRNYMNRTRGDNKVLPDSLNLKYICKNDSDKLYYFLELVSDDTQEITFSGNRNYVIGAADYYSDKDLIFITYQRKRQDEGKMYYLASFNKSGLMCDSLLVLSTNPEGDFVYWVCSKIFEDKILVFEYKADYSQVMKTAITLNVYRTNNKTGQFILEEKELFESDCSIDDFNGKTEKCRVDDPYYKFD